jgi:hypothetical protein
MKVTPFVAFLGDIDPARLRLSADEISEAFCVDVDDLLDDSKVEMQDFSGLWSVPRFTGGAHPIWGLTAYITQYFLKQARSFVSRPPASSHRKLTRASFAGAAAGGFTKRGTYRLQIIDSSCFGMTEHPCSAHVQARCMSVLVRNRIFPMPRHTNTSLCLFVEVDVTRKVTFTRYIWQMLSTASWPLHQEDSAAVAHNALGGAPVSTTNKSDLNHESSTLSLMPDAE